MDFSSSRTRLEILHRPDDGDSAWESDVREAVHYSGHDGAADRRLRPLRQPDPRPFDEVVHWDPW
jgi:hypothetical protein